MIDEVKEDDGKRLKESLSAAKRAVHTSGRMAVAERLLSAGTKSGCWRRFRAQDILQQHVLKKQNGWRCTWPQYGHMQTRDVTSLRRVFAQLFNGQKCAAAAAFRAQSNSGRAYRHSSSSGEECDEMETVVVVCSDNAL